MKDGTPDREVRTPGASVGLAIASARSLITRLQRYLHALDVLLRTPVAPLSLMAILAVSSMAWKSATYDEPVLLTAGTYYLHHFDPRVNAENPPLLKALYALPSLFFSFRPPRPPERVFDSYDMHDGIEYGVRALFSHPRALDILFSCRLMGVLLGIALGGILYTVARGHWGRSTAMTLLWVYALSPNILAHVRLFTPDFGITFFFFLAILFWLRLLRRGHWSDAALAGIALGGALLSKYTGILLLPIFAVQAVLEAVRARRSIVEWLRRRVGPVLLAGLIALFCIGAAYGFRDMFPSLTVVSVRSPLLRNLGRLPILGAMPLPVPEAYLRGLDIVAWNNRPGFPAIFLGRVYPHGASWAYYYLAVLALKTPLPLLIAWGLCIPALRRRSRREQWNALLWSIPPCVVFLNFSLVAYRQLGLRYILPVWPFAILFLGYFVHDLPPRTAERAVRLVRWSAGALLAWFAAESLFVYPDYLSYFNELAGGSKGGWRYLAASNADWGQDLPALARWQRQHGNPNMYVLYYGTAPLAAYGVRFVPWGRAPLPPCGPSPRSKTR